MLHGEVECKAFSLKWSQASQAPTKLLQVFESSSSSKLFSLCNFSSANKIMCSLHYVFGNKKMAWLQLLLIY